MANNNDLNMFLKSQVIKLKAELDLTDVEKQLAELRKKLQSAPLKLKVEFDYDLAEFKKKIKTGLAGLDLKLDAKLDDEQLKKDIGEVKKEFSEISKEYGEQLKRMEQQSKTSFANINREYSKHIDNIARQMKQMYGDGLFKYIENRDAEGNIKDIVAQLEKANGIVEQMRFVWDKDAGDFVKVGEKTVDSVEKSVNRAAESLRDLRLEIEKLQRTDAKVKLMDDYSKLEKRIGEGTLTQQAVRELERRIQQEKFIEQEIEKQNRELYSQERLLQRIKKLRSDFHNTVRGAVDLKTERPLLEQLNQLRNRIISGNYKDLRDEFLQFDKINAKLRERIKHYQELEFMERKRTQTLQLLKRIEMSTPSQNTMARRQIENIREMTQRAQTIKDWLNITKSIGKLKIENQVFADAQKALDVQFKLKQVYEELYTIGRLTDEQFLVQMKRLQELSRSGYADLNNELKEQTRRLQEARIEMKKLADQTKVLASPKQKFDVYQRISSAIDTGDIESLKQYIGEIYRGQVATIKIENATDQWGRAVNRMKVHMAGAGKSVRTFVLDLDKSNKQLRQVQSGIDYNINRNLGVIEQLRIAMARVPVWMTAMTAFYGSIRSVRAMSQEILEVDKALTELRRVAGSNINIESLFQGAVNLSAELGNNIHDILQTLNDFARTFGEFNERQLLAITKTATLMSNVSELTAQEAGQALISTMNAFNIEAEKSMRIVDAFNEVDNNFAVSTKQIAESMTRSASAARTFGVEMEESIGHVTAISSVTMESGKIIGNALKTIYSRITTMDKSAEVLQSVGIAIRDQKGDVREVQDILSDLAAIWGDLSDAQRQNIAVTLAGRYQLTRFLALMNNWDTAVKATQTALTSQGSALRENAKYMQSYEARLNKLRNAFTELSLSVGDSVLNGAIYATIELLTDLARVAIDLSDKFGALSVVLGGLGATLTVIGVFRKVTDGLTTFGRLMAEGFREASAGMTGFRATAAGTIGTLRAFQTVLPTVTGFMKTFGSVLKSLAWSTVIGGIFFAIGSGIEWFIRKQQEQKRVQEEVEKMNKQLVDSYRNTAGGLEALVEKYNKLKFKVDTGQIQEGTEAYNEYLKVNQELAEKMPNMVKYVDSKGIAHLREAEALRENVKFAKELSEAYAKLTLSKFEKETAKRSQNIKDTVDRIKELNDEIKRMQEVDGTTMTIPGSYNALGEQIKIVRDYGEAIQENKIKVILAQQEIQNNIQKTNNLINQTILSSIEASGKLQGMTETQISTIEKLTRNNEKIFMDLAEKLIKGDIQQQEFDKLFEQRVQQLYDAGVKVGQLIADKLAELIKGVTNKEEIQKILDDYDTFLQTLPDKFFTLDNLDNIDQFVQRFEAVLDIANKIKDGTGDMNGLIQQIASNKELGMSFEEARKFVIQLGFAYDNQAIKTEALKQKQEGLVDSLDEYVDKTIEAIDVSEKLFGFSDADLSAVQSHIELLKTLKGLGEENTDIWRESVSSIADYFLVTEDFVEKNINKFYELISMIENWEPKFDKNGNLEKSAIEAFERIKKKASELGIELTLGDDAKIQTNTQAIDDNTRAKRDNKQATEDLNSMLDTLNNKFQAVKESNNDTTMSAYIETVKAQVDSLSNKLTVVADKNGNLKLQMADASLSPWLQTLQGQLNNLGLDLDLVKTKTGEIQLVLNTPQGDNIVLKTIKKDAEEAKTSIGQIANEYQNVSQKVRQLPLDDGYTTIDLRQIYVGLDDTLSKTKELELAVNNVNAGFSKLQSLEGMIGNVSNSVNNLRNAFLNLFSDNTGDLGALETKARAVKQAMDEAKKALDFLVFSANNIKADGMDLLVQKALIARAALLAFQAQYSSIIATAVRVANAIGVSTNLILAYIVKQVAAFNILSNKSIESALVVSLSFETMRKFVSDRTSKMISWHNKQRSAINNLAEAARNARSAISNLNDAIGNAMYNLNTFMDRARRARVTASGLSSMVDSPFVAANYGAIGETVSEAISSFTAMSGEGGAEGTAGGGTGTSGIIRPSIYDAGWDLDGHFSFIAFAKKKKTTKKEPLPELYTFDKEERQAQAYESRLRVLETRMRSLTENTLAYRNALKQIISESQKLLAVQKKDLAQTEARNKQIEKELKKLSNTKKHSKAQRERYNELQREYEQNLSKIQSLRQEIEDINQDIRERTIQIFTDWLEEFVGKYDKAINTIKGKIDDTDFKLEVLSLTDPDNAKKELELLSQRAKLLGEQKKTTENMVKDLQKEYDKAVKKYGKSSKQALAVKEQLDAQKEALEDVTIELLRTEKQIQDTRREVANRGIEQLKNYYSKMKEMALDAIDREKEALKKAHDEKMKMYDEQIAKINKVYDEQLKQLDRQKEERDFQEELNEKNQQRAELLNKITLLSRSNALEDKKKVQEYQKQLQELDKEIAKMMRDRQDELLKQQLEDQRDQQIEAIEKQKEAEQEQYDQQIEELDKKRDETEDYYDDIINNEQFWKNLSDSFVNGNIKPLVDELQKMTNALSNLNKGNFSGLIPGMSSLSEEVKKQLMEAFDIDIANLIFGSQGMVTDTKNAGNVKYVPYTGKGTDYNVPTMTTYVASTGGSRSSSSSSSRSKSSSSKTSAPQPRYHKVKKGDTLWELAEYYYKNPYKWTVIAKANKISDPRKLQIGTKLLIPFDTGGYTGYWPGKEGRLAILHRKELVLNERQTEHILDTAKIMDRISKFIPDIQQGLGANQMQRLAAATTNNVNINVEVYVEGADKKKAKDIGNEVAKKLLDIFKKKGQI